MQHAASATPATFLLQAGGGCLNLPAVYLTALKVTLVACFERGMKFGGRLKSTVALYMQISLTTVSPCGNESCD
jgi:hypothetical protein